MEWTCAIVGNQQNIGFGLSIIYCRKTFGVVFDTPVIVYQPTLVFNRLITTSVTPVQSVARNLVRQYWQKERERSFARVRKYISFFNTI